MSGIFGIFNRDGNPVDKAIVNTMLDAMSYWEPDERDIWIDGSVALGHIMLWNTPESKYEHLPLKKESFVLAMDARIDNRDELAQELTLPDRPLEEIGDSEFILAAYHKWGEECQKHLLGDFAFVIWDERKKQLFCARDPFGIKLFHYYIDDEVFVFSNDIRGVMAHVSVSKKYDEKILSLFLRANGIQSSRDSFFEKIKKLPAATSMIVRADTVREKMYWKIEECPPIRYKTYQAYTATLRSLLEGAVKARLRTVYPVVSHLSGGIDSSPIAVLAARQLRERHQSLHAYNWIDIPNESDAYEVQAYEFSRRIAKIEAIEHHEFTISPAYMAEWFDTHDVITQGTMYYIEEDFIQNEAKKIGARTILSGWGGDEFISNNGYSYIAGLFKQGRFREAFKVLYNEKKSKGHSWYTFAKQSARATDLPLLRTYINWRKSTPPELYELDDYAYITNAFRIVMKKHILNDDTETLGVHNRQKMLFHFGHIQERIESWALGAFSNKVEYHYPLLDRRIVEFALGIPEELFFNQNGHKRHLIRNAIVDLLPHDILWSSKIIESKIESVGKTKYKEALEIWYHKHKNSDYVAHRNAYVDDVKIMNALKAFCFEKDDVYILKKIVVAIMLSRTIKKMNVR